MLIIREIGKIESKNIHLKFIEILTIFPCKFYSYFLYDICTNQLHGTKIIIFSYYCSICDDELSWKKGCVSVESLYYFPGFFMRNPFKFWKFIVLKLNFWIIKSIIIWMQSIMKIIIKSMIFAFFLISIICATEDKISIRIALIDVSDIKVSIEDIEALIFNFLRVYILCIITKMEK